MKLNINLRNKDKKTRKTNFFFNYPRIKSLKIMTEINQNKLLQMLTFILVFPQVMNFSAQLVATFIAVVGVLSVLAQVSVPTPQVYIFPFWSIAV